MGQAITSVAGEIIKAETLLEETQHNGCYNNGICEDNNYEEEGMCVCVRGSVCHIYKDNMKVIVMQH